MGKTALSGGASMSELRIGFVRARWRHVDEDIKRKRGDHRNICVRRIKGELGVDSLSVASLAKGP